MWGFDGSVPFGASATYKRENGVLEAYWTSGAVTQAVLHEQTVLKNLGYMPVRTRRYWLTLEEANALLAPTPFVLAAQHDIDLLLMNVMLRRPTESDMGGTPMRVIKGRNSVKVEILAEWHLTDEARERLEREERQRKDVALNGWKTATAHVASRSLRAIRLTGFDDDDEGYWEQVNIECPFCHAFSPRVEDEVGMSCESVTTLDIGLSCRTCLRTGWMVEDFLRLEEG